MQTDILHTTTTALPVMESFYTIQGEGFHQGRAAYFIRLGGCDVGCVWCDVKESWDASKHPKIEIENIVGEALTHPGRLAVVTGGEPLHSSLLYQFCNIRVTTLFRTVLREQKSVTPAPFYLH